MRSSVPLLEVIARFRRGSELREAIGQGRIVIAVGPSRVWNHIWSSSCPRSGPDNDVVCSQAILPLYTLLGSCWELPDHRITLSGTVEGGGGAASPHLAGGRGAIHHMRGVHMERRRTQGSPMLGDWRRACRMINAPTGLFCRYPPSPGVMPRFPCVKGRNTECACDISHRIARCRCRIELLSWR